MSQILASTYEITGRLGSGGGGVVYEGRHLRLGKKVVLKADKRTLAAPPEVLRREVDTLKNLSHTYIPQVYDFVVEDGVVYTVMDYIEGESLDKPLKRGEWFSQPQVIQWAKELLEALCYLHSQPPYGILHGDIKPANIMRTPQGDIRLIDFNIALFLGEEGAVRVGYSQGYASPEHYGSTSSGETEAATELLNEEQQTEAMTEPMSSASGAPSSTSRRGGILDTRSDLYSLGATLYHLLTGRRPAKNAREVSPILDEGVSPAVADIIRKAMEPDPEERYQSAEEMLFDFAHLYENDFRTKRLRRQKAVVAGVLAAVFLAGGLCTFLGLKQMEQAEEQRRLAAETAERALTAVTASEAAFRAGDLPAAVCRATEALDSPLSVRAQKALTDALGVYDLSSGFKPWRRLDLPAAPVKAVLSPGGTRAASLAGGRVFVFDTQSGEMLAELTADPSALSGLVFSGEDTLYYAGEGALTAYDLAENRKLWAGKPATGVALSADGSTLAAIYKDENVAAVYDAVSGEVLRAVTFQNRRQRIEGEVFADAGDNLFALSGDGEWLAVSFSDGSLTVFDLSDTENDLILLERSDYTHFEGGFFGQYFAFSATRQGESIFAVIDMETMEQIGGFQSVNPFRVQTDETGIAVATENILVRLDPKTGEQTELAYPAGDIAAFALDGSYALTALNGSYAFFDDGALLMEQAEGLCDFVAVAGDFSLLADRNTPALRVLRLEQHPKAHWFAYDPEFPHDEARVSRAGNVMLFQYDGFRLYGPDGAILAETALPDPAGVYDQQFRREADCLEVLYRDGTVRRWSASDGQLLSEAKGEPPDGTMEEVFLTDRLRIISPLHGTPAAYDRESGERVRELEKEDYLTYVTQVGEYIVTEYVTAQGKRYGLLLNGECETLAILPGLCDILEDDVLVFDDMRGNLWQSHIYSTEELKALSEQFDKEEAK